MNKIIQKYCALLLIFALNASALFVVQETHAYFSDTAVVSGNAFSTGTLYFEIDVDVWKPSDKLLQDTNITREVDIDNKGTLDFQYEMSTDIILNEDDFCNEFTLKAKLGNEEKYNGNFVDFTFLSSEIESGEADNWEFMLSRGSSGLTGVNCNFDFVFEAWQTDLSKDEGFTHSDSLFNEIHNSEEDQGPDEEENSLEGEQNLDEEEDDFEADQNFGEIDDDDTGSDDDNDPEEDQAPDGTGDGLEEEESSDGEDDSEEDENPDEEEDDSDNNDEEDQSDGDDPSTGSGQGDDNNAGDDPSTGSGQGDDNNAGDDPSTDVEQGDDSDLEEDKGKEEDEKEDDEEGKEDDSDGDGDGDSGDDDDTGGGDDSDEETNE